MTDQLIPRDVPLQKGRRLLLTFTVTYPLPIDDDLLQDQDEASMDDIEQWLGHGNDEEIFATAVKNYDRQMVELITTLDDSDSPARFETTWERESRLRGDEWQSREWLDEVPPARQVLRPQQCISILTTVTGDAYCERTRGHEGIHTPEAHEAERLDREASTSAGAST